MTETYNYDAVLCKFTGKERDAETGLDFFGARYLSSSVGRWMSPDWAAEPSAVPYAIFGNPQSLNLYGYVGNNPLLHVDPDGHCWPPSACAEAVIAKVNQIQQKIETKAIATGNPAIAATATFYSGVARDIVNGFANLATIGKATGAVMDSGSTTQKVLAISGDLGKAGRIALLAAGVVGGVASSGTGAVTPGGLADNALVVRGGVPTAAQLTKGAESIGADGTLTGVSVQSANGATVEQLSQGIPNNQIGVTTVGDVRAAGGDVVSTPQVGNPCHCDMNGVTADQGSKLFTVQPNPSKIAQPR